MKERMKRRNGERGCIVRCAWRYAIGRARVAEWSEENSPGMTKGISYFFPGYRLRREYCRVPTAVYCTRCNGPISKTAVLSYDSSVWLK